MFQIESKLEILLTRDFIKSLNCVSTIFQINTKHLCVKVQELICPPTQVSFFIPPDIVPARIVLLVTLCLVLINMFNSTTWVSQSYSLDRPRPPAPLQSTPAGFMSSLMGLPSPWIYFWIAEPLSRHSPACPWNTPADFEKTASAKLERLCLLLVGHCAVGVVGLYDFCAACAVSTLPLFKTLIYQIEISLNGGCERRIFEQRILSCGAI